MPTFADPYFLDGTTLSDSTAVFQNSGLTILAPDGYYSDGVIIRQQVNGLFLPQFSCPACGLGCGEGLTTIGSKGAYYIDIDTGTLPTDVGAIVIRFATGAIPDAIQATYDGQVYNELSSPFYGYLAAPPGLSTWIGDLQWDCGLVSGSPHTVDVFEFNGTSFETTGATEAITILPSQLQLTPNAPDDNPGDLWPVMVIPKTSPTPSLVSLKISAVCGTTGFLLDIICPKKIKGINASARYETLTGICQATLTSKLYPVRVNGIAPYLGLYDWVFLDEYGATKAADGYYRTNNLTGSNDTIQVQNGTVIAITNECP
jgi:hypothetical protein